MMENVLCICGNTAEKSGICVECKELLKVKKLKNIAAVEAIREKYNASHDRYMTYGQFVGHIEAIYRRKKEIDYRRKKASIKEIRSNRRKNRAIAS